MSARDRLHLAAVLPTLIVWGERDSIIPVKPRPRGARGDAREPVRGLRRRGHMPHHDDPERFAAILTDFCAGTEPARLTTDHWRPLMTD